MKEYILRSQTGASPLWTPDGENVPPASLPLSPRLLLAIEDWAAFYDDVGGALDDLDVAEEFVGQGFKIAHALRRELKGSEVWLEHPLTGESVRIERRRL